MMHMFVSMTGPTLGKIEAAFAQGDTRALRELAHSLKGGARSACCLRLGDLAAEMQVYAEKNQPITADMVAALKIEFARVSEEVKNLKA
jgi:HPt (histidine-containing phosphotransfer) domain-containing protein